MKSIFIGATLACLTAASAHAAPVQWTTGSGGNGHWYDFVVVPGGISAPAAEAAAESSSFMGLGGYLATITSAAEQSFLNTVWPGAGTVSGQFGGYSYFLIGASDRDTEGTFEWIGGPEEGDALVYTNWDSGEPNNLGDEDYTVAWWEDSTTGAWNDGGSGVSDTSIRAYLVEYSIAPVPVPAGLPLLLAGLGGLAMLRKRKR